MTTQTHLTNMYGMSRDTCTGCPATLQARYPSMGAHGSEEGRGRGDRDV